MRLSNISSTLATLPLWNFQTKSVTSARLMRRDCPEFSFTTSYNLPHSLMGLFFLCLSSRPVFFLSLIFLIHSINILWPMKQILLPLLAGMHRSNNCDSVIRNTAQKISKRALSLLLNHFRFSCYQFQMNPP